MLVRTGVGGGIALGALLLAMLMIQRPAPPDLSVIVSSPRPFAFPEGVDEHVLAGSVAPQTLATRVGTVVDGAATASHVAADGSFSLPLVRTEPGIHTAQWKVVYGGRWERVAGLSFIEGPFATTPTSDCNAQVTLSQGFLDDGAVDAGDDLATALQPILLARVQELLDSLVREHGLLLKPVERVQLQVEITPEGLRVRIDVPDFFWIGATVAFDVANGGRQLVPRRVGKSQWGMYTHFHDAVLAAGRSQGMGEGAVIGTFLGCLVGACFVGALGGAALGAEKGESKAEAMAGTTLDESVDSKVLRDIAEHLQLPEIIDLSRENAGPAVRVRFCADPSFSNIDHVTIGLSVNIDNKQSRSVEGLAGPVFYPSSEPPQPEARAGITIDVSPNVLNALMYGLWQSTSLRKLLSSEEALTALNANLDSLSLDVRGIDPVLPPVLKPPAPGGDPRFELQVGELHLMLGERGKSKSSSTMAVLSGRAGLGLLAKQTSTMGIEADVNELLVSCIVTAGVDQQRRPCFSDLLQLAMERIKAPSGAAVINVELEANRLIEKLRPQPKSGLSFKVDRVAAGAVSTSSSAWLGVSADVRFSSP